MKSEERKGIEAMRLWMVLVFVVAELAIGLTVVRMLLGNAWRPLQTAFPSQAPLEPHYRRNFQSFSFGLINAGFSIHVIVDDQYLHLIPAKYLRMMGLLPVSVPWSEIQMHAKQPSFGRQARAHLGKTEVVGPAWCFEMLKI